MGVDGAFTGATATHELGAAETRFFIFSGVVLLAYAALTNIDAVLARSILPADQAGAYAGAITTTVTVGVSMARVVLAVALATQAAAVGTFVLTRVRR